MSLVPVPTAPAVPVVTGPVTLRDELELWQEAFEFAKAIASTDLVPKECRNNPPAIMARIIKGHELGVPALHALSQIYLIEGRPCVAAELQRALILAKGHDLWTEESTITRVTLCGRRRNGEHVQKVTWTMDDAKRANLAGKQNWRTYPRAMLLARCSGELGRLMFADVLAGLGVNLEELTDGVIDVTTMTEPESGARAPSARTTRRTTKANKNADAALSARGTTSADPPAPPTEPGGQPPRLPDEDNSPVQPPTDTAPNAGERHTGADPAVSDETAEPVEVVTKRAQSIAMQAGKAGVDHHHVIAAVTHGNKTSAKDVTAAEADAVLHALVDIKAGRLELIELRDEGATTVWELVSSEPPDESRVEEYQARIRKLRRQRQDLDDGGQQTLDPNPEDDQP